MLFRGVGFQSVGRNNHWPCLITCNALDFLGWTTLPTPTPYETRGLVNSSGLQRKQRKNPKFPFNEMATDYSLNRYFKKKIAPNSSKIHRIYAFWHRKSLQQTLAMATCRTAPLLGCPGKLGWKVIGPVGYVTPRNTPCIRCISYNPFTNLREPQHTPGAYPMNPQTPKWKESLHKLLNGGLVCVTGLCWKILRTNHWSSLPTGHPSELKRRLLDHKM